MEMSNIPFYKSKIRNELIEFSEEQNNNRIEGETSVKTSLNGNECVCVDPWTEQFVFY